jgi:hypothetical protein
MKKVAKIAKKFLTIGRRSGILTKLSVRTAEAQDLLKKVNEFCKK